MVLTDAGADALQKQCGGTAVQEAVVDVKGLTSNSAFLDVLVTKGPNRGCHLLLARTAVLSFSLH
jgi:hypothetical protein